MLTGTRAFGGDDVADTLADVLKSEPEWTRLPVHTPVSVRRLLRRCIAKDRKTRLSDIGVARLEIDDAGAVLETASSIENRTSVDKGRRRRWLVLGLVAIVTTAVVAGGTMWAWLRAGVTPSSAVVRFAITLPSG